MNGKDRADAFLRLLRKEDHRAYRSLITRIRAVAEHDHFQNQETFRSVGEGIFEFKRNTPKLIRLYAFYHQIDGVGQLILCTNGGDKRAQNADIEAAKEIKKQFLAAVDKPSTTLTIDEPKP